MNDDLLIRDRSDPLYEDATPPRTRRYAHHLIPLSDEPFTKTELSEIRSRRNDEVFPPLTRLWVLIKIRTGAGRRPYRLTNVEAEEIGLSRWQKFKNKVYGAFDYGKAAKGVGGLFTGNG